MKRTQRNVFLAGVLVLSLSACSSWGGWRNPFGGGGTSSPPAPASTAPDASTEKPAANGTTAAPSGQKP